jgi:hypothetical protein
MHRVISTERKRVLRADARTLEQERRGAPGEHVAMSGPAGVPQEGKSVEERRAEKADWRERCFSEP